MTSFRNAIIPAIRRYTSSRVVRFPSSRWSVIPLHCRDDRQGTVPQKATGKVSDNQSLNNGPTKIKGHSGRAN